MEIRELQFFCLTAEFEHITKAAAKLGVAQPYLTKVIKQIENEVGIPLFDNIGRSKKLNEHGKKFYVHAKKILVDMENLRNDMEKDVELCLYTIKIMTNQVMHYPEVAIAYLKFKPCYSIVISTGSRKEILNSLRAGETDFGLCSPPLVDDPRNEVKTDIILTEEFCVMLPPDHPMLKKKAVNFSDLIGEPMITTSKESALRLTLDQLIEKYNSYPKIVCESNDINLIIRAVISGIGFAILPCAVKSSFPWIRQYCVEFSLPDSFGNIGISYSKARSEVLKDSEFLDFIKKFTNDYSENNFNKEFL